MIIKALYNSKHACYSAVLDVADKLDVGDTIEIDGMTIEDRVVHLDVVKALIHATRDDSRRNFQRSIVEETHEFDDGWTKSTVTTRKMLVTCTGHA